VDVDEAFDESDYLLDGEGEEELEPLPEGVHLLADNEEDIPEQE